MVQEGKHLVLTGETARQFAEDWVLAWNSHDLDAILSHYDSDVSLTSPTAARLLNDPSGTVNGIDELRAYFQRGLQAYPDLRFELLEVMWGLSSMVLCYRNQKGAKCAEFMEFAGNGKVVRVVANYNA